MLNDPNSPLSSRNVCRVLEKKGLISEAQAKEIEKKERIIVGVNQHVMEDEEIDIPILLIDESIADEQCAFVQKIRADRDNDKVKRSLEDLQTAAKGNGNTLKAMLDCVRVYTTMGEICDALKPIFGEYTEPPII